MKTVLEAYNVIRLQNYTKILRLIYIMRNNCGAYYETFYPTSPREI